MEKDSNLYESKLLNVCTTDDSLSFVENNHRRKSNTLNELGAEVWATFLEVIEPSKNGVYHISWAVFQHIMGMYINR